MSHFKRSARVLEKVVLFSKIHMRKTNVDNTISTSVTSECTEVQCYVCGELYACNTGGEGESTVGHDYIYFFKSIYREGYHWNYDSFLTLT